MCERCYTALEEDLGTPLSDLPFDILAACRALADRDFGIGFGGGFFCENYISNEGIYYSDTPLMVLRLILIV